MTQFRFNLPILCTFALVLGLMSPSPAYAATPATLVEGATLLTLAEGQDDPFNGFVLISDGKIVAVEEGEFAAEKYNKFEVTQVVDAQDKMVIPGFVSGHNHLWQSAFRGIAAGEELFDWLEGLHWTYGDFFSDGDFYTFTLHGALDQLAHGITTTYNHSQRLGGTEAQYLESFDAELEAGQHFIFSYNADVSQSADKIKQDVADFVAKAKNVDASAPLLGLSINAVGGYRDPEKLRVELELAKKYNMTAQIHYLEEFNRRFRDRKKWPMLKEVGAVADNVSFAHFIHTTDTILKEIAAAGGSMIWNPLSNGRLASGLSDIPKYIEMGVGVGMGVDGAASADIADPFENMRMGTYALRMQHKNAQVMMPLDILRLHTIKTAEVLKIADQVGTLEPGKYADLLIIDPADPVTGAIFDVPAHLVFACNAANIEKIMVRGNVLVEDGKVLNHDMAKLQQDLVQRVTRIRNAAESAPTN